MPRTKKCQKTSKNEPESSSEQDEQQNQKQRKSQQRIEADNQKSSKQSVQNIVWTVEQKSFINKIVKTIKQTGKEYELKQSPEKSDKTAEPEWTTEQDELLGKFWEENNANFSSTTVWPQFEGHSKRGAQLRLALLTKSGKLKPQYRVDQEKTAARNNFNKRLAELKQIIENLKQNGEVDWEQVKDKFNEQESTYIRLYLQRKNDQTAQTKKWTQEQIAQLKQAVAQQNGEVDWNKVSKQLGKKRSNCISYYTKLVEPEWTAEQDEILGKFWEENNANFDILTILPQLGEHTKCGAQLRLAQITNKNTGNYKPSYYFDQETKQKQNNIKSRIVELEKAVKTMQQKGEINWDQLYSQFNEPELVKHCIKLAEQIALNPSQTQVIQSNLNSQKITKWTQEQIAQLTQVVGSTQQNEVDWELVAQKCCRKSTDCKKTYQTMMESQWTEEQQLQLKSVVETMKQKGEVDWNEIGRQLSKNSKSCHNEYIKLTEPEWTTEQDELLGKFWEENNANFTSTTVWPQFEGHTKRGAQLRLAYLTNQITGKYQPSFSDKEMEVKLDKIKANIKRIVELEQTIHSMQQKGEINWDQVYEQFNEPYLVKHCIKLAEIIAPKNRTKKQTSEKAKKDSSIQSKMWTEEQLTQLKQAVASSKQNGQIDWELVAQQCGKKSINCKKMFKMMGQEWTKEQEAMLKLTVETLEIQPFSWPLVGKMLGRTGKACKNKYTELMEQNIVEQDEILGKYWEANHANFDIGGVMPQLAYTLTEAKFRLQYLTDPNMGAQYQPQYVPPETTSIK